MTIKVSCYKYVALEIFLYLIFTADDPSCIVVVHYRQTVCAFLFSWIILTAKINYDEHFPNFSRILFIDL